MRKPNPRERRRAPEARHLRDKNVSHLLFPWTRSRSDFGRRRSKLKPTSPGRGKEMPRRTAPPIDATRVARVENVRISNSSESVSSVFRAIQPPASTLGSSRPAFALRADETRLPRHVHDDARRGSRRGRGSKRRGRRAADAARVADERAYSTYLSRPFTHSNFPTCYTHRLRQFAFAAASPPLRLEHPHPVRARHRHFRLVRREFDRVRGCG